MGERVIKAPLKIKNDEGEVLCIVYPQRRTVVLLDIDGGMHYYSVPMGVRKLRAPSVSPIISNNGKEGS